MVAGKGTRRLRSSTSTSSSERSTILRAVYYGGWDGRKGMCSKGTGMQQGYRVLVCAANLLQDEGTRASKLLNTAGTI